MKDLIRKWNQISLVKRIIIGLVIGIILAFIFPNAEWISIFGSLFVNALKAVAPILVLFLVLNAIARHKSGGQTNMKSIIVLYLAGTALAGLVGVIASFMFPVSLTLTTAEVDDFAPPSGISEVLHTLLFNIVDNPVSALMEANYIGILTWALLIGIALRKASDATKSVIENVADAILQIVKWVISLAPLGIMGLVYEAIVTTGAQALLEYGKIIAILLGCMFFVALVMNPIIVFICTHKNPYPLVLKCIKDSGITAFFTRSSAANIPVNMELCKELDLDEDTYSISIPLGATINMAGAAVTISVLTLAAAHTLDIQVDIGTAVMLTVVSAISAAGASGVPGGSLLLIPLAASLFGISNDIAMQVVGVGFIIGVVQDSCETALNSHSDVIYTAAAEQRKKRLEAKQKKAAV